jgi:hypothetical protein
MIGRQLTQQNALPLAKLPTVSTGVSRLKIWGD